MAVNMSNLASALRGSGLTEEQRRLLLLDQLGGASAESAPTAQRGVASGGDKLMSADVRAPSSLRPSNGNRTYGSALPKVAYQEIKEATPGGGTKTSGSYSYSSGGGVTEPWAGSMPTFDPFSYAEAPTYGGSQYDNRRDQLLSQLEGSKFSYDPASDPVWQSYQKQYRREGQRAAEDAMGRAAASTGGVASSYAAQAASQAGNYYAAQLSDRLPQVYQDAYNRYLQEYERQLGLADTYNSLGQQDYNKYRDTLAQYNTDRNFAYGVYSDDYNRQMDQYNTQYKEYLDEMDRRAGERSWEYSAYLDELDRAERADQTAYNREQDAKTWEWKENERDYGRGLDAEDRARQAWLDSQTVQQNESKRTDAAWDFLFANGFVTGEYAATLGYPNGTTLTQILQDLGIDPAALGYGGNPATGSGGYTGGPGSDTAPTAERTAGDGYTYSGTHENGLKKTVGYEQAFKDTQAILKNEKGTDAHKESVVLRYLMGLVSRFVITDDESKMIYALLGFGTPEYGKSSAGNTRISIGPNNVQMVQ